MIATHSLWATIATADPVVKTVILILISASVLSWTFIVQRAWFLNQNQRATREFEELFWSGQALTKLYADINAGNVEEIGMRNIFCAGFKEYIRLRQQNETVTPELINSVQRAMRIAYSRESMKLEKHLGFLASVGSISPYIGLFGTVWGIMASFHALGNVQQATIAMVAPGISEALIATAIGLFAAIPAVLAYNRYTQMMNKLLENYETFQDELVSILERQ